MVAIASVISLSFRKKKKKKKRLSAAVAEGLDLFDANEDDKNAHKACLGTRNAKKLREANLCSNDQVDVSCTTSEMKKIPSRSARRKKAKRQWLKELRKANNDEEEKETHTADCVDKKVEKEIRQSDRDSDEDEEAVPVVIRPGHIRFAPLENGLNDDSNSSHKPSETRLFEEGDLVHSQIIEFEKLAPYANTPKEDDVIAYRIIQLSSSWTPELSSYLVGKISQFNPESNMIKLVAFSNHPLIPDNKIEDDEASESDILPETLTLQEDGSLEVEFSSLLEVRAVKCHDNISSAEPEQPRKPTKTQDEISRESNSKREELFQEDFWDVSESSGRDQWTLKALRRSALGPTMALLRSQNEI
ncbi:COIL [Linum perenne]